jgi:hypothetical protein
VANPHDVGWMVGQELRPSDIECLRWAIYAEWEGGAIHTKMQSNLQGYTILTLRGYILGLTYYSSLSSARRLASHDWKVNARTMR